jgi:hypothetical protein
MRHLHIRLVFVFLVSLSGLTGCSTSPEASFDTRTGVVSKSYQVDAGALVPDSVRQDSKYSNYYMSDHLVFLGQKDSVRYALSVTFGRALADNRYKRAERDFTGFLFDGRNWVTVPYTLMKQDSLRLDVNYPYVFGGLQWTKPYSDGEVSYDRRDLKFSLRFSDLKPVQSYRFGETRRRSHAIGEGTLVLPAGEIHGTVFYELTELEGYNPLANVTAGLKYVNYDWLALQSPTGMKLICTGDSATTDERLRKNFLALLTSDQLRYADGSDNARISSDGPVQDPQSGEVLALRKNATVPALGIGGTVTLADRRVFSGGRWLALVDGALLVDGRSEAIWGLIEHRQQMKRADGASR